MLLLTPGFVSRFREFTTEIPFPPVLTHIKSVNQACEKTPSITQERTKMTQEVPERKRKLFLLSLNKSRKLHQS